MKKCIKCGTEFDGNFCPKCGTSVEQEFNCPKCGKKLDIGANFCKWCGCSFGSSPNQTNSDNTKIAEIINSEKIYRILKIVPVLMFVLFSILLFIFYAAPVAIFPGIGESYGSAYTILREIPEFNGEVKSLFVFAVFSLLFVSSVLILKLLNLTKFKKLTVIELEKKVSVAFKFLAFVFYFIFFLLGCILCGKVASLDEGMGFMSAGACPILILIFSIIFAIISAGALLVRYFISKKFPEYAKSEVERANRKLEKYKEYIKEVIDAGAPEMPKTVKNPVIPSNIARVLKFCRVSFVQGILFIIFAPLVLLEKSTSEIFFFCSLAVYVVISAFILFIFYRLPVKTMIRDPYNCVLIKVEIILCIIIGIVLCFFSIVFGLNFLENYRENNSSSSYEQAITSLAGGVFNAIYVVFSVSFFTTIIVKLTKEKKEVGVSKINEQIELYDEQKLEYENYLIQFADYEKQNKKYLQAVEIYKKLT